MMTMVAIGDAVAPLEVKVTHATPWSHMWESNLRLCAILLGLKEEEPGGKLWRGVEVWRKLLKGI